MAQFRVWDEGNCSEENCGVFEADSPEEAAELYAAEDQDGLSEGLYSPYNRISVRDEAGKRYWANVVVDYDPTFTAVIKVTDE